MYDTDEELNTRLRHAMSLALWYEENADFLSDDKDEQAEMYEGSKSEYLRRAARLIMHLDRQNISLSLNEEHV